MRMIVAVLVFASVSMADVIEVGDLNIIDDAGNPSDGLRYLDTTFSVGLTEVDALANAQGTYANARLATAMEFDDLMAAAGIRYDGLLTASDAFSIGVFSGISTGANYDGGVLAAQLGRTNGPQTLFWSDPDGSADPGTTRDNLWISGGAGASSTGLRLDQRSNIPPHNNIAWLIVSDPVPEPATLALFGVAALGAYVIRRRRKAS